MTDAPTPLRTDETPCLLFPELHERGGGLQRAVQERASLYARGWEHVLLLTTGFSRGWERVPAAMKERGTLDPRVRVRNFFAHSRWASQLGVPPLAAYAVAGEDGVETEAQGLRGRPPLRLVDRRAGERRPFRYRYFDRQGALLLTTFPGPESKHEQRGVDPEGRAVDWPRLLAEWVDDELADLRRPVLFSLQRGLNDPVLMASRRAYRRVASLHNCHYVDPEDRWSGTRPSFRTLFTQASRVDTVVCLTEQQRLELERDAPGAHLVSIPYPGRPAVTEDVAKEPGLVVLVGQLVDRKRVDHAVRAMAQVVAEAPHARLEVYGEGPAHEALQRLVDELGLTDVVTLKGYSHEVGRAQARACCTLMTSTFEGFARVIGESMVRGTPVVSYDVRYGPRDLVRHAVDGLLVTEHTPDALAAAVLTLLRDPERAYAMGRRGLELPERFPVEDFERAWTAVLTAPARRAGLRARASDLRVRARRSPTVRRLRRLGAALPRRGTRPGARTTGRVRVR